MLLFSGYMLLSLAVGVASHFLGRGWTVLASALTIVVGVLISTWPYIDVATWGVWVTLSRTIFTGFIWSTVPATLFFIVPFLVGRYGYQLLLKTVLRSARG